MEEDFEKEVRRIKSEIKKKKRDEVPDMDEVLKLHKKKLIVKMKNYKYTSINDIF